MQIPLDVLKNAQHWSHRITHRTNCLWNLVAMSVEGCKCCHGIPGKDREVGPRGATGPPGATGMMGRTGVMGMTGPSGKDLFVNGLSVSFILMGIYRQAIREALARLVPDPIISWAFRYMDI